MQLVSLSFTDAVHLGNRQTIGCSMENSTEMLDIKRTDSQNKLRIFSGVI